MVLLYYLKYNKITNSNKYTKLITFSIKNITNCKIKIVFHVEHVGRNSAIIVLSLRIKAHALRSASLPP